VARHAAQSVSRAARSVAASGVERVAALRRTVSGCATRRLAGVAACDPSVPDCATSDGCIVADPARRKSDCVAAGPRRWANDCLRPDRDPRRQSHARLAADPGRLANDHVAAGSRTDARRRANDRPPVDRGPRANDRRAPSMSALTLDDFALLLQHQLDRPIRRLRLGRGPRRDRRRLLIV
jgi:hypothetical protein